MKFSIPYNGDFELMRWAVLTGHVYEIYFNGLPGSGNGASKSYPSVNFSEEGIARLLGLCNEHGMSKNLLINKSVLYFEDLSKLTAQIRKLQQLGGLDIITVGDKSIVPFLRQAFPEIKLQASVYLHIDTAEKVKEAFKMGIGDFCLDVSVNRNGRELGRIRDLKKIYPGIRIKLLANHSCYRHCFYADVHEDWHEFQAIKKTMPQKDQKHMLGNYIQEMKCSFQTSSPADEIKRPFIRPEDVSYYEKNGWTDYIKIANRMDTTPVLRQKLESYFNHAHQGNLFDIIYSHKPYTCLNSKFPQNFVAQLTSCDENCHQCNYCEIVAKKVLRRALPSKPMGVKKHEGHKLSTIHK